MLFVHCNELEFVLGRLKLRLRAGWCGVHGCFVDGRVLCLHFYGERCGERCMHGPATVDPQIGFQATGRRCSVQCAAARWQVAGVMRVGWRTAPGMSTTAELGAHPTLHALTRACVGLCRMWLHIGSAAGVVVSRA